MNEKEMLLLSNYVYMDISTDEMSIGDSIDRFRNEDGKFDAKTVRNVGIGGGLSADDAADLFNRIDEMPKEFKDLYPSKILNEDDVRGICYTNGKSDTGKGCVVFRGTGGTYEAWHDNVLGQCRSDTDIQMRAADFVDRECCLYSDLSICGHSKGGNLAMYTTVVSTAAIGKCVSFDGQGFSDDFLRKYPDEIAANAGKIKSVNAYNDFVNILLNPIAGETVYTENGGKGIDAHSSYQMLVGNDFDSEGNLVSLRDQSVLSHALGDLADDVSERLNMLPGSGNRDISGLLAALVAGVISSDRTERYEKGRIVGSTVEVGEYLLGGVSAYSSPVAAGLKLYAITNETTFEGLNAKGDEIEDIGKRISHMGFELDELSLGVDPDNKIDCYLKSKLASIRELINANVMSLNVYSSVLKEIGILYDKKEKEIGEEILMQG